MNKHSVGKILVVMGATIFQFTAHAQVHTTQPIECNLFGPQVNVQFTLAPQGVFSGPKYFEGFLGYAYRITQQTSTDNFKSSPRVYVGSDYSMGDYKPTLSGPHERLPLYVAREGTGEVIFKLADLVAGPQTLNMPGLNAQITCRFL